MMKRCHPLLVVLVLFVASAAACASIRANRARNQYINDKTKQYVYDKPCKRVWPAARQLLFEAGYSVEHSGDFGGMTVETDWRRFRNEDDEVQSRSRYLVQGIEPRSEKCKVRFNKMTETDEGRRTTSRDLNMEWKLINRVSPEDAAGIQKTADLKAERARNQ